MDSMTATTARRKIKSGFFNRFSMRFILFIDVTQIVRIYHNEKLLNTPSLFEYI